MSSYELQVRAIAAVAHNSNKDRRGDGAQTRRCNPAALAFYRKQPCAILILLAPRGRPGCVVSPAKMSSLLSRVPWSYRFPYYDLFSLSPATFRRVKPSGFLLSFFSSYFPGFGKIVVGIVAFLHEPEPWGDFFFLIPGTPPN